MKKPDKLESSENNEEDTPEMKAVSDALKKISEEPVVQEKTKTSEQSHESLGIAGHDEHKHEHDEESKKTLKDIAKRAEQVGGKPGEKAKQILENVESSGLHSIQSPADFSEVFESLEMRKKYYPDWNLQEVQQLYEVLYGEGLGGESFEDAQKNRAEAVESAKQLEETLAKEKLEREKKEAEGWQKEKEQRERENRELEKEEAEKAERERRMEAEQAEQERKSRWLGLGRFFGGRK